MGVINYLRNIAEKLGVENTRKHLIPYLTRLIIAEKLADLKDLAVVLGDFECYVGGPKYAHILLVRRKRFILYLLFRIKCQSIKLKSFIINLLFNIFNKKIRYFII